MSGLAFSLELVPQAYLVLAVNSPFGEEFAVSLE